MFVVGILTATPAMVRAQLPSQGVGKPKAAGENGFKLGSGRLHALLETDTRYVTNPGRVQKNAPNDVVLVVRPGLEYLMPGSLADVSAKATVSWWEYLNIEGNDTSDSTNSFDGLNAGGNLKLLFNKDGKLTVGLFDSLNRTNEPGNQAVRSSLRHTSNEVGIQATYKPGGGALVTSAGYSFYIDHYDRDSHPQARAFDNVRHKPRAKVAWRFLPQTSAFIEAQGINTDYTGRYDVNGSRIGTPSQWILRVEAGANGAISSRLAALLKAGYGQTFQAGDDRFLSAVGQAELRYVLTATTRTSLGYARSVEPTPLYKYFGLNRLYAGVDQALGGRSQLKLRAEYSFIGFGDAVLPSTSGSAEVRNINNRSDGELRVVASYEYQVADWFVVMLGDVLELRTSNQRSEIGSETIETGYFYNVVYLRLAFRY